MTPDDLIAAVRARLDETERIARAATPGPWEAEGLPYVWDHSDDPAIVATDGRWVAGLAYDGQSLSVQHEVDADAEHIAYHDPAAVLRRVAADRRMFERHECCADCGPGWQHRPECHRCAQAWPCDEIRDLAEGLGIDLEETPQ